MFGGDADRSFVHVVMNETVVPLNIGVVFLRERLHLPDPWQHV